MRKKGIIKRFARLVVFIGLFLVLGVPMVHGGCPAGTTCTNEGCMPKVTIPAAVDCATFNYSAVENGSGFCDSYYCDLLGNGCSDKNNTALCFQTGSGFCYYCNLLPGYDYGYSPLPLAYCFKQHYECTDRCGNASGACFASCPGYGPTEAACEDKCRSILTNCECDCDGAQIDCENKTMTSLDQQRVQCLQQQQQSYQPQQLPQPQTSGIWEWLIKILSDIWNAIASLFGFGGTKAQCPVHLQPCGGGCIPQNALCCDNGVINSYCLQPTSSCGQGNCHNCSQGEVHCGMSCIPAGQVCCLGSICPENTS